MIFQGTEGQNKLDGPISQSDAEKNFKKKFKEKTKNAWDERQQFSPVKGKYELVRKSDQSGLTSQSQVLLNFWSASLNQFMSACFLLIHK